MTKKTMKKPLSKTDYSKLSSASKKRLQAALKRR
jgi:hypothetical protein